MPGLALAPLLAAATAARLAVPALSVPREAQNARAEQTAPCPIAAQGPPATLRVTTDTICGGSPPICGTEQRVDVEAPATNRLPLRLDRYAGEDARLEAPLPAFEVACEPGRVVLTPPSGAPLAFLVDRDGVVARPSPDLVAEVEALWNAKPGTPRVRARAAEMAAVLGSLAQIPDLAMVTLLFAREDLLRQRFASFDAAVPPESCARLAEPAASRCRALVAERKAAGERTQPVRFGDAKRLGLLGTYPVPPRADLPPVPGPRGPEVFWRGRALCVEQEDGSGTMRCYDAAARRWGAREPLVPRKERPTVTYSSFGRQTCSDCGGECEGTCVGCEDCDGTGLPDRRILLRNGTTLQVASSGPGEGQGATLAPITPEAATALLAKTSGSTLCGGARLSFSDDRANELFSIADPQLRWHPLPDPNGEVWSGHPPPLVSPDQRHVVVFSTPSDVKRQPVALWLFRIEPSTPPAR